MTCREVEEELTVSGARGAGDLKRPVRAHIEGCKTCQEFARIVELPLMDPPTDSLAIERLQKMILSDLRPVNPLLPSWVFLAAFAVTFSALAYLGILYLGAYGWPVLMPSQKIAIFSGLAASAALLSFSLVRQMVPGQKTLLRPSWLPVMLFVSLCLVTAGVFQVRSDPHFLQSGETCLKAGLPWAIPAALVFWLILRRGVILFPRAAGVIAGMLAGLVSTTVLEVHCPNLNVGHILVWHIGIALLGMIAGLLVATAGQAIRGRLA